MNVYDLANNLATEMKKSQEFIKVQEAKKALDVDKAASEMVKDFNNQRRELEMEQLSGKEPNKEKIEKVQNLYNVLAVNTVAAEYVQAEMRFQMMLNDVSKVIGDVVKEAVGE